MYNCGTGKAGPGSAPFSPKKTSTSELLARMFCLCTTLPCIVGMTWKRLDFVLSAPLVATMLPY